MLLKENFPIVDKFRFHIFLNPPNFADIFLSNHEGEDWDAGILTLWSLFLSPAFALVHLQTWHEINH